MNKDFVKARFGKVVDLGECSVGRNLNLIVLRGFAPLDRLSVISDADVYDQVENPLGTQRNIKKDHARECLEYALSSLEAEGFDKPYFFPEVLLNARDRNVVTLYDVDEPQELYDLDSYSDFEAIPAKRIGVRINLHEFSWPKLNRSPFISRVDGNHRLFGTDELLQRAAEAKGSDEIVELPDRFPEVPFSLLIGLEPTNEARLFRDINGEHKGMETTHLASLEYRISDADDLKRDEKKLPLWIAYELNKEGRSFDKKVFFGGSKKGSKKEYGFVPPIRINSLRQAIKIMLDSADTFRHALKNDPEAQAVAIDSYWTAVKRSFPQAWEDRTNYILLQTIGFNAFAKFGGKILDRAVSEGKLSVQDFENYLAPIKTNFVLDRSEYRGVAGAGGTAVIYEKLNSAWQQVAVLGAQARAQLLGRPMSDLEKLDLDDKR